MVCSPCPHCRASPPRPSWMTQPVIPIRHSAEDLFSQVSPNPAVGFDGRADILVRQYCGGQECPPSERGRHLTAALAAKILKAIMKRRFRRGMLAALIAGVTFFYPLLAPTPHRIDEAHFRQIQPGMTRAQVEAIFGAPPGEYDWAEADGAA